MRDLLCPLPQSEEYARALRAMGLSVRAMCQSDVAGTRMCWQVQSRRFGPLGRIDLISRGPVVPEGRDATQWLYHFGRWQDGRPLLLNAAGLAGADLRAAGFWPLLTPGCLGIVDLGDTAGMRRALAQKWRNRLNRAEALGLRVSHAPLDAAHWLLEAERVQARQRGYRGLPPGLALALARTSPGAARFWEVRDATGPLAAVLVLRHGPMATWQIGHVTPAGRRVPAMNLALWSAMCWLADAGHRCLDLGVLNTDDAAGLSHFKLGTGARVERLGGTWLHLGALAPLARRLPRVLAA
jgi:hypothetical protein